VGETGSGPEASEKTWCQAPGLSPGSRPAGAVSGKAFSQSSYLVQASAHGREAIHVHRVWQGLRLELQPQPAPAHPHGREALRVPGAWQGPPRALAAHPPPGDAQRREALPRPRPWQGRPSAPIAARLLCATPSSGGTRARTRASGPLGVGCAASPSVAAPTSANTRSDTRAVPRPDSGMPLGDGEAGPARWRARHGTWPSWIRMSSVV